jgi:polysaccharide pyruvyl transferase WcaK-like protein
VAEPSLHDRLSRIASLREILAEYGAPTARLADFMGYNIRDGYETLELGVSALSISIARHAKLHTCIVPSDAAAEEMHALCTELGIMPERLRLLVGENPEAAAGLPANCFDHVILSAPFTFPGYFAAAHAAFRLLKPNRRLTVRGAGVWSVDQLRNFLRIDPAWDGYEIVAEDAIAVTKQAASRSGGWRGQPYVVLNSTALPSGSMARSLAQEAQIRNFSNSVEALQASKRAAPATRRAGLVGYYGFGNYGDELFRQAFEAGLPEIALPMLHDIPRRPYFVEPKIRKVARVDAVVIGGGDLIIPGYWTDLYFENEYLVKPVFVHGVGVPRWTGGNPGVIKRMREFFQSPSLKFINVRDIESKEWVEKHLNPVISVDLSPDIVCGMELRTAPPKRKAEPRVLGLITRKQDASEAQYRPIRALIERAKAQGYRVRLIIAGNGPVGEEDYDDARRRQLAVDEVSLTDTVEGTTAAIISCDALASMKFHGCVVGLMAGIPTIGLQTTDKFNSFYKMLGLEQLLCHYYKDELPDRLDEAAKPLPTERIDMLREGSRAGMARLRASLLLHTNG